MSARKTSGTPVSQDSQFAIELDLVRRQLAFRTGETAGTIRLRSRARMGLICHLIEASRTGHGYCSASEIRARAPGWSESQISSVGKRFSAICTDEPAFEHALDAPSGTSVGPWRLRAPPTAITIKQPALFDALLRERHGLPADVKAHKEPHEKDIAHALAEAEYLIEHGHAQVHRAPIERVLQRAAVDHREIIRADGARMEARLLRHSGNLTKAAQKVIEAANYFAFQDGEAARAAFTMYEIGALFYRLNGPQDALPFFREAVGVLRDAGIETSLLLARCLRGCALAAMRSEAGDAISWARDAEKVSSDAGDTSGALAAAAIAQRAEVANAPTQGTAKAVLELQRIVALVPVIDPKQALFVRRLLVEALYVGELPDAADELALAVFRDALSIDSARDADATVAILRMFHRRGALGHIPRAHRSIRRDSVDDPLLLRKMLALPLPQARRKMLAPR